MINKRMIAILVVFKVLILSEKANAEDDNGSRYDLSVKVGAAIGAIEEKDKSEDVTTSREYKFGGLNVGTSLYKDLHEKFSGYGHIQWLIAGSGLFRESYGAGIGYHIIGGSKSYSENHRYLKTVKNHTQNFSVFIKGELQRYHVPAAPETIETIEIALIQFLLGIEYRKTFNAYMTFGVEAYTSMFNSPLGSQAYLIKGNEASVFYRFIY